VKVSRQLIHQKIGIFSKKNKCKEKYIPYIGYNGVSQNNRKSEECETIIPYIY
jgi:hypothetical protein